MLATMNQPVTYKEKQHPRRQLKPLEPYNTERKHYASVNKRS